MIICPNCNHQNPEGSVQCESCYTPLPSTSPCPNCGALVQTDATFCGQCGYNLQGRTTTIPKATEVISGNNNYDNSPEEDLIPTNVNKDQDLFQSPWDSPDEDKVTEITEPSPSLSLNQTEMISPPTIPFEEETSQPEQLEEIPSNLEESGDLDSWLSSMQESSFSEHDNSEQWDEIPDLGESSAEYPDLAIPSTSVPDLEVTNQKTEAEAITSDSSETAELATPESSIPSTSVPDLEIINQEIARESEEMPDLSELPELGELPITEQEQADEEISSESATPDLELSLPETPETTTVESSPPEVPIMTDPSPQSSNMPDAATRLQLQKAVLFHVQTGTNLEMPLNLAIVRIGKPNNQVPPDIDVSGFPNSEIVSRIHADIRVEGDMYFIEDRGSSNGTYINHSPLLTGNRHRLRAGDRISLGKGDLMTFIFQLEQI